MDKDIRYLDRELEAYGASSVYPFHMPGHKRQSLGFGMPETIDITEVDGFDNLHHAEGIIAKAQERMAELFGADASFFLVNGSTCGLLAAISAAVPRGGKILIARNCHKAVYHGIFLRGLSVEYVYPQQTLWGIQGSIDPAAIEEKLQAHRDIKAVLITSPTYDGVVSDIESISEIVHGYNIPLIVDEAHGAHFGFAEAFPKKAHWLGADVVIESMHKTLPAFTQSAALHVKGDRVDQRLLQKYLGIYQSSSPSYLFMAGLDRCVRILKEEGPALMGDYQEHLKTFYEKAKQLEHLQVFPAACRERAAEGIFAKDISKILIFTNNCFSGSHLGKLLLKEYGLQMEMESSHYVTALTSMMDTEEGFLRLWDALKTIDESLGAKKRGEKADWISSMDVLYQPKEKQMEIEAAFECDTKVLPVEAAGGAVSCEFVYLYPPGIPFLVPGEVITEDVMQAVQTFLQEGFDLQGLEDHTGATIKVAT